MSYYKLENRVVVLVSHPKPDDLTDWNFTDGDAYVGQIWDGTTLTNPPPPPPSTKPADYILTPRQFNHMAALAGYDDAISAILAAIKPVNIALYAEIKAGVIGSKTFHFDKVKAIITNAAIAPLIPAGVDVSTATLAANWLAAKDY